jgi:hypothetical protein
MQTCMFGVMLSVIMTSHYTECHQAEKHGVLSLTQANKPKAFQCHPSKLRPLTLPTNIIFGLKCVPLTKMYLYNPMHKSVDYNCKQFYVTSPSF